MKEKAHRCCRKELPVNILHTSLSEPEREDRNLRPPKSRDYLLCYLNSVLQTLLFPPDFRSTVSMYFVCLYMLLQY